MRSEARSGHEDSQCTDVSEWPLSAFELTMHATSCLNPIMTWKKHQFGAKNTATHRGKRLTSPPWHCSVVKGFGCSYLGPAPIRLILMFGRGPRWGSKINIMFFFFSGPYLPERHVGSWSHCANQHSINQYSKCILYYCITRLEKIMINSVLVDRSNKNNSQGRKCMPHFYFITHVYKTLKRT